MHLRVSPASLLIAIMVCVCAAVFLLGSQSRAADSLDSPEAEEIKAALQRAKVAIAIAQRTGDFTKLGEALVDHPDYLRELSRKRKKNYAPQSPVFSAPMRARALAT